MVLCLHLGFLMFLNTWKMPFPFQNCGMLLIEESKLDLQNHFWRLNKIALWDQFKSSERSLILSWFFAWETFLNVKSYYTYPLGFITKVEFSSSFLSLNPFLISFCNFYFVLRVAFHGYTKFESPWDMFLLKVPHRLEIRPIHNI